MMIFCIIVRLPSARPFVDDRTAGHTVKTVRSAGFRENEAPLGIRAFSRVTEHAGQKKPPSISTGGFFVCAFGGKENLHNLFCKMASFADALCLALVFSVYLATIVAVFHPPACIIFPKSRLAIAMS